MSDNKTAISHINKKGGTRGEEMVLNDIAVDIWLICQEYQVHISAAHIPGKDNVTADIASREFIDSAEWMISPNVFHDITKKFGMPDIDLFATRLNAQLPSYVSWNPDPHAKFIDAFTISWHNRFIYLFPPFSLVWPVLSKIEEDQVERAILIVPKWSTQAWFPRVMEKALQPPQMIDSSTLMLPGTTKTHPLAPKLRLMAVLCSWRTNGE